MPTVGQTSAEIGNISESQASDAVNRLESALAMINTPSEANNVLGFIASFFTHIAAEALSFVSSVLGFGIDAVSYDLNAQLSFYQDIVQMYADDPSILGVQVKQVYIYRRCLDEYGWYPYGSPQLIAVHYPGGWEPV